MDIGTTAGVIGVIFSGGSLLVAILARKESKEASLLAQRAITVATVNFAAGGSGGGGGTHGGAGGGGGGGAGHRGGDGGSIYG